MKYHFLPFFVAHILLVIPIIFAVSVPHGDNQENAIDEHSWKHLAHSKLPSGRWATPAPDFGIDLGFTPVQMYLQVRRTNSVQHLPRSEAYKESVSPDELLNAHRLKEVLRTKKVQEVYSEEGFEDSGYDHGDHERHAEHEESYNKHKDGKIRIKEEPKNQIDDVANAESKITERKDPKVTKNRMEHVSMEMKYSNKKSNKNYPKKFKRAYPSTARKSNFIKIPTVPTFGYIHSLTGDFYRNYPSHLSPSRTIPSNLFQKRKKREVITPEEQNSVKETIEYEKELSDELDKQEGQILKETFKNLGPYNQIDNIDNIEEEKSQTLTRPNYKKRVTFDLNKYPFYTRKDINPDSPLRYASHPKEFPKKSGFGMEWYDQKDRDINCPEVNFEHNDKNNPKRIVGLGDKIECMKNKYFGEDPLDSPFFTEPLDKADQVHYHPHDYQPNRTMSISTENKPTDNFIQPSEVKPKYEVLETTNTTMRPVELTTKLAKTSQPLMSLIVLPHRMKKYSKRPLRKLTYPKRCIYPVSRISITKRSDIFIDCLDVSMMQTSQNGRDHIKIYPKRSKADQFWLPATKIRSGEVIEGNYPVYRKKRSTTSNNNRSSLFPKKSLLDKITKRVTVKSSNSTQSEMRHQKNLTQTEMSHNKSTLQVDLGIHSPDELANLTTTTTERLISLEPRKLTRLSGKTFLDRYHASKKLGKGDFWTTQKTEVEPTPMLLYFVDKTTGSGKWVSQMSTETIINPFNKLNDEKLLKNQTAVPTNATTTSTTTPPTDRKMRKMALRKQFLANKLKKNL